MLECSAPPASLPAEYVARRSRTTSEQHDRDFQAIEAELLSQAAEFSCSGELAPLLSAFQTFSDVLELLDHPVDPSVMSMLISLLLNSELRINLLSLLILSVVIGRQDDAAWLFQSESIGKLLLEPFSEPSANGSCWLLSLEILANLLNTGEAPFENCIRIGVGQFFMTEYWAIAGSGDLGTDLGLSSAIDRLGFGFESLSAFPGLLPIDLLANMIEMSVDVLRKRDEFGPIVDNVLRALQKLLGANAVEETMLLESGIISELFEILQEPNSNFWSPSFYLLGMCVIRPGFAPVIEHMNVVNICSGILTAVEPESALSAFYFFLSNVLAVNPEPISELIECGFFRSCLDVVIGLQFDAKQEYVNVVLTALSFVGEEEFKRVLEEPVSEFLFDVLRDADDETVGRALKAFSLFSEKADIAGLNFEAFSEHLSGFLAACVQDEQDEELCELATALLSSCTK